MKSIFGLIAVVLILAAAAFAQTAPVTDKTQTIFFQKPVAGDQDGADSIFLLSDMDGVGKVVKNAPYTATAVTETTQTLGDGNHIVNTTTAQLARDSEGRTRREENCAKVGNLQANALKMVTINDPVAKAHYMFMPGDGGNPMMTTTDDPAWKHIVVHQMGGTDTTMQVMGPSVGMGMGMGMGAGMAMHKSGTGSDNAEEENSSTKVQHESLGTQVIEGVNADGVRDTRTIPAGSIGNEKPIVITSETWTSPDLQMVVLSKRNDPRFGETVYKLTDINRSEPDPSLFQVPANAKKGASK